MLSIVPVAFEVETLSSLTIALGSITSSPPSPENIKKYITIEYASLLSNIEDEQSISNQDSYARFKDKGNICLKRNNQIRNLKSNVSRENNSRKAFGLAFCYNATTNNLPSQKSNNKIPLYLYTRNLLI